MRKFRQAIPAIITIALAPFVMADDWDNSSGDAQWSNSVNWSDNTEPTAGESAIFPAGFPNGATDIKLGTGEVAFLIGFGDNYILKNLLPIFDTATLTLASGVVDASAGKSAHIHVRLNSSAGLTKNGAGSVSLYRTTTIQGPIYVEDGTLALRGNVSGYDAWIAPDPGSAAVVTIDGATAQWTLSGGLFNGSLYLGDGTGTLNITGGGQLQNVLLSTIGTAATSIATVNVSGVNSAWTVPFDVYMGAAGATSTLNITGGTVTVGANIEGGPGVSTVTLDGGTLDMTGGSIGDQTFPINNLGFRSGTLKNVNQINGDAGLTKTTAGMLVLEGTNTYTGATTVSAGTLKLSGDGSFASSPIISLAAGATLDGSGVTSGANFDGAGFALAAGQMLTGSGALTGSIGVGAGSSVTLGATESLTVSNNANINAGTVTVVGGSLSAANIIGNGTLDISSGAVDATVLSAGNDGTLTGGSGTGDVTLSGGTVIANAVLLGSTTGGSGNMTVSGSGDLTTNRLAANDFIVDGGSVTVLDEDGVPPEPVLDRSMVAGYLHDGALIVNAGTVTTPNIKLGVTAGMTGTYTQSGGSLAAGSISVGSSAGGIGDFRWSGGTLSAQSLEMAGPATLGVSLAGDTLGDGYAQLQVSGNATLTGMLEITWTGESEPQMGDSFIIMTFASRSGEFAQVNGTSVSAGKDLSVQYHAGDVTLVVVPSVPGDMNCDGVFDILDVPPLALALTDSLAYGQQFQGCDPLNGDMNHDLTLDGLDIGPFVNCLVNGGCQ